jgi:hypothetical protein
MTAAHAPASATAHGPRRTRLAGSLRALALLTPILCLLAASPASAEIAHVYESQIPVPGESLPWGLAFTPENHLLVADARQGKVDVFDSTGAPVPPPISGGEFTAPYRRSVAVSAATGVVYVGESGQEKVDVFKPEGANTYGLVGESERFAGYVYVAVDNSTSSSDSRKGDVYVLHGAGAGATLSVFKPGPEGQLEGEGETVTPPPLGFALGSNGVGGLAVDPANGDVYVANPETQTVDVFNDKGEEQLVKFTAPPGVTSFTPIAVAPDSVSGQEAVYVVDAANRVVDEYSKAGTWLGQIKSSEAVVGQPKRFVEPLDVTVAEGTGAGQGRLYVSDGGASAVDVFAAAGVLLAEVTTPTASGVTATAATVSGTVNPDSVEVTSCNFEYRTTTETTFTHSAACSPPPGSGSTPVAVSATLAGLTPNSPYVFRLAATNANGTNSSEATFLTPGPPQVRAEEAEVQSTEKAGQTAATLRGEVNPDGAVTTYRFEYGETTSYGTNVEGNAGEGTEFAAVPAAALTGLKVGTTYHYRLTASNQYGETAGPDETFTTTPAVLIDESVTKVTAESATLRAQINPLGNATTYYFQYGTVSCESSPASCTSVPAAPASVGSGETTVEPTPIEVQGLTANTTYHYRLIATNSLGTVQGADRTFTTQSSERAASLIDGRMWELVSPAEKHGTSLESITEEGGLIQAAEDGSGLAYIAKGPVQENVEGNRSIADSQLLAKRENGVWSTRDITTPHENPAGILLGVLSEYKIFSNDLSAGFVRPAGATRLAPQATEPTPYLRETATGAYVPLVYPGNVPAGAKWGGTEERSELFAGGVEFLTATPDGKHAILGSSVPLTTGVVENGRNGLYDWTAGSLFTLVSQIPTLPATTCGGSGSPCVPAAEVGGGVELGNGNQQVRNAISDDGNRVTFMAQESLFVRDLARGETVHVDVPQAGAPGESGHAIFQLASSDGHRVFFTDELQLTTDATANGGAGEKNLYMCTIEVVGGHLSCALKDLTVPPSGEAADVQFAVIGTDTAGGLVYFVANGALTPDAVHGDCKGGRSAQASAAASCNLYVYDAATEQVRLVAVLSNRDSNDWGSINQALDPGTLTSRVSPNGRFLAFMSRRPLTGFDNRDAHSGEPAEEVFLYDASTGALRCVSCSASGARPAGVFDEGEFPGLLVDRPQLWGKQSLAGSIPGWTRIDKGRAHYQSRYLSDEGRLFFNSPVGLVPGDNNGREDVYEFEPAGVGGCPVTQPNGCQALISSGTSSDESAFLDASATGEDVFFLSSSKLVGADRDNALDVYDAHVCTTAVPCPSGTVNVPAPCNGTDSCRAAPAPQPVFGAPASATFTGAGNPTPSPIKPASKPLTRAQKLAKALKACRTKHNKHRRTTCEKQARHTYAPARKAKRANTHRRASR